jgi:ATPase subunit of ABC transporter with duplicated ATPase domains
VAATVKHVAAYMKDFLFSPEQARTPVHALSGGERARLMLARALACRPTFWCWTNRPMILIWRRWICWKS